MSGMRLMASDHIWKAYLVLLACDPSRPYIIRKTCVYVKRSCCELLQPAHPLQTMILHVWRGKEMDSMSTSIATCDNLIAPMISPQMLCCVCIDSQHVPVLYDSQALH